MLNLRVDTSVLRQTRWYEYVVRFAFGGVMTAATGLIAKTYGPVVGGLFLAFPAIFPASATLIETHERRKKQLAGQTPGHRGRDAAALDAAGAAMGSLGLLIFAAVVWRVLPGGDAGFVLAGSALVWFATSLLAWRIGRCF